ncbi:DUF1289 domain-containing protein [Sphingomonas sp. 3-13AW]|uniref:DUF1289 domain-containing protein n=1 Tax=Sphingomonas sp. 3-13AW TaxID=3050450 RepID=UPI003BB6829E
MDDFIEYVAPVGIESPCVLVCTLDLDSGWCFGCGRTSAEISGWTSMTAEERDAVTAALPQRCALLDQRLAATSR